MSKRLITFFLFVGISTSFLFAQKVSYRQLVMRSNAPDIFIDEIILPGEKGNANLAFIFRFNHDFIPFKKLPLNPNMDVPEGANFYSTIRLNTEVFKGKLNNRRQAPTSNSASRDTWSDTLFTETFEQTQSGDLYTSGSLSTSLPPGDYNYMLQLTMMQELNERNTQRRNVKVPDLSAKKDGEVILVRNVRSNGNQQVLQLMNLEKNVPFGDDFYALIRIPNYEESTPYQVEVRKARAQREDTTSGESIYTSELPTEAVYPNSTVTLSKQGEPTLTLKDGSFTYAIVSIPGSTFDNSTYFLSLTTDGEKRPVARTFFRSYWPDMPASLYNLSVAIDNMKYIVSEKELERLNRGNDKEREQKFREFWESRDPTPETVYNELMAEYYNRIDYAYQEFGTQENPMGHESDQGEVYIKFGPPSNKERRFPEKGRTLEIWEYPNRTFVFEATTGFGDFTLVATRK